MDEPVQKKRKPHSLTFKLPQLKDLIPCALNLAAFAATRENKYLGYAGVAAALTFIPHGSKETRYKTFAPYKLDVLRVLAVIPFALGARALHSKLGIEVMGAAVFTTALTGAFKCFYKHSVQQYKEVVIGDGEFNSAERDGKDFAKSHFMMAAAQAVVIEMVADKFPTKLGGVFEKLPSAFNKAFAAGALNAISGFIVESKVSQTSILSSMLSGAMQHRFNLYTSTERFGATFSNICAFAKPMLNAIIERKCDIIGSALSDLVFERS